MIPKEILENIRIYLVPIIVAFVSFSIAWTTVTNEVRISQKDLIALEKRVAFVETCFRDSADRLMRIETNIEHITKIVDKEYNGR